MLCQKAGRLQDVTRSVAVIRSAHTKTRRIHTHAWHKPPAPQPAVGRTSKATAGGSQRKATQRRNNALWGPPPPPLPCVRRGAAGERPISARLACRDGPDAGGCAGPGRTARMCAPTHSQRGWGGEAHMAYGMRMCRAVPRRGYDSACCRSRVPYMRAWVQQSPCMAGKSEYAARCRGRSAGQAHTTTKTLQGAVYGDESAIVSTAVSNRRTLVTTCPLYRAPHHKPTGWHTGRQEARSRCRRRRLHQPHPLHRQDTGTDTHATRR